MVFELVLKDFDKKERKEQHKHNVSMGRKARHCIIYTANGKQSGKASVYCLGNIVIGREIRDIL